MYFPGKNLDGLHNKASIWWGDGWGSGIVKCMVQSLWWLGFGNTFCEIGFVHVLIYSWLESSKFSSLFPFSLLIDSFFLSGKCFPQTETTTTVWVVGKQTTIGENHRTVNYKPMWRSRKWCQFYSYTSPILLELHSESVEPNLDDPICRNALLALLCFGLWVNQPEIYS